MTPDKIKALRISLRDELRLYFPRANASSITQAINALVPLILRESFNLVEMEHERDCACWHCVRTLSADVIEHAAKLRVAREAAEDHD